MDKDNTANRPPNPENQRNGGPKRTEMASNNKSSAMDYSARQAQLQQNLQNSTINSASHGLKPPPEDAEPPRRYGTAQNKVAQTEQSKDKQDSNNAKEVSAPGKPSLDNKIEPQNTTKDTPNNNEQTITEKIKENITTRVAQIKKVHSDLQHKTEQLTNQFNVSTSQKETTITQTPVDSAPKMATQTAQALGKITPKKQAVEEPKKFSMTDKVSAKELGLPTINQSIKLEESPPPRKSQLNIFAIFAFLAGFIVWSMLTEVDEVAVASGQVIPTGFVKSVQHLEGGIVAEVLVEDGDIVEKGQLLLKLDSEASDSDLEQTLVRRHALSIQAERLRSLGTGVDPDFNKFKSFPDQDLITDQKAIYQMQKQNLEDQLSVINTQIEQQKASMTLHMGRLEDLQKQLNVAEQQRDVHEKLMKKRLVTRTVYLESQREVHEVATEVNQARNQILETKESISEQHKRIIETKTRLRNEALREMGAITSEIAQLDEAITRLQDKVKRLEITAPSSGIIKGLKATSLRGIIQPGDEIMQIVPRKAMEVEARVEPKDIGNVKVGQSVKVKVTAFDYARYGDIPGRLHSISASTFKDEEGKPYYLAQVKLSKYHLGNDASRNHITPGMTAMVDVDTGEKTLFEYFIKPIIKALDTSFRER